MYVTHALKNLSAPDLDHFRYFRQMCPWAGHPYKKCVPELNPGAPIFFENRNNPKKRVYIPTTPLVPFFWRAA